MARPSRSPASAPRSSRPRNAAPGEAGPAPSVEAIAERILHAIWEHRLPPGTKLVEERLSEAFGVSRTKIRLALARLAHERVLTVYPNRGTFVASPTVDEARQVFRARRLIEPALVRAIAGTVRRGDLARLRATAEAEAAARGRGDRRALVRLSGEFHVQLAELDANPFVIRAMRELCSLTCLIIALYDAPGVPACPQDEHLRLVDLLAAADGDAAAEHMLHHLAHVEQALDMRLPDSGDIDLAAVFADAPAP